jgi:hypothetical protein
MLSEHLLGAGRITLGQTMHTTLLHNNACSNMHTAQEPTACVSSTHQTQGEAGARCSTARGRTCQDSRPRFPAYGVCAVRRLLIVCRDLSTRPTFRTHFLTAVVRTAQHAPQQQSDQSRTHRSIDAFYSPRDPGRSAARQRRCPRHGPTGRLYAHSS